LWNVAYIHTAAGVDAEEENKDLSLREGKAETKE